MSLDVTLTSPEEETKVCNYCGSDHNMVEQVFEFNITHNLGDMARKAGLYKAMWRPEEIGATKAKHILTKLDEGIDKLKAHPSVFKKLNPDNGWGDYYGLLTTAENYLEACKKNPESLISAHR